LFSDVYAKNNDGIQVCKPETGPNSKRNWERFNNIFFPLISAGKLEGVLKFFSADLSI